MSQIEVLNILRNLRAKGDEWYTAKQIQQHLKDSGKGLNTSALYNDLFKLSLFNMVEVRGVGYWNHHKEFRGLKE